MLRLGLQKIGLTGEEFYLTEDFVRNYKKLSRYDCIALAVAKIRQITLLTGDGALRKAAATENVPVIGTIGILDQLYEGSHIGEDEFHACVGALAEHNGGKVRLPDDELRKRMK